MHVANEFSIVGGVFVYDVFRAHTYISFFANSHPRLPLCVYCAGPLQSREATVQVLPSVATSQGPAADQRPQPFGTEERPDAPDGHCAVHTDAAQPGGHSGELDPIAVTIRHQLWDLIITREPFVRRPIYSPPQIRT